jgi:hypothetical protein
MATSPVLPLPLAPQPGAPSPASATQVAGPASPAVSPAPPAAKVAPPVSAQLPKPLIGVLSSVGVQSARRQISPISGMALEALGHAIEYLADEYALHAGRLAAIHAHDPQVEAIQILMAANRAVYYDCPIVPAFSVRCKRAFARLWGRVGVAA